MKKSHVTALLICLVLLLGLMLAGGYIALDHTFPEAGPIPVPSADDITSMRICEELAGSGEVAPEHYGWILETLRNSEPTRKMSVNDYPTVKPYYSVTIDTPDRTYHYYLYTENSQIYIESPYNGIYKTDRQLLDFILGE